MSTKNDPVAPENPIVKRVTFVFFIVALVGYQQALVPWLFPGQRGFNPWQTLGAAIVGAVAAVLGAWIGKLIVWFRK